MPRVALRILQIGAIAVVIVALPYTILDLDRFLIPKELVLHLTAVLSAIFAFNAIRRLPATRVDVLLALYLLLSLVSAALATNRWLALRALAVSASAIVIYWVARALAAAGLQRQLLNTLVIAVTIAAVTALLQAYGVRVDYFATSRAPGGTLGNRNFVAHVAAFGLPLCIATNAWPAVPIVSAALVLTRSRAAWLACAAMLGVFIASVVIWRQWDFFKSLIASAIAAAIAIAAALFIPNALHWRSDNPYTDTMQSVANYQEGSGRGRLVQYERSILMSIRHPLFGVGPGNWPVVYPSRVPRNDPSLDPSSPGMTFNPWPSSDWIAFISERGFAAAVLLALAFVGIVAQPRAAVLHAVVAAVMVVGLFDAVLLLAVPTMLVWIALGALVPVQPVGKSLRVTIVLGAIALVFAGALYSAAELFAIQAYVSGGRATLETASSIDPGNYRIHMRLAQSGRNRCAHAQAAHELYPTSADAARLARGCR